MRRILATGTALLVGVEALAAWWRPGDTGVALGIALMVALLVLGWAGLWGISQDMPDGTDEDG